MLTHRLKILASMLIAIILVEGYTYFSQNPTVIPIQAENIKGLLSNLKFSPQSLTRLFNIKFSSEDSNLVMKQFDDTSNNAFNFPTSGPQPTEGFINETPTPYSPTSNPFVTPDDELVDFPIEKDDINNIPVKPTKPLKPTNKPKAATTPKPAIITADLRPGSTLDEILKEVNRRACIPVALLKAIQYKETGAHFKSTTPASTIKNYNTYGWWITGIGDPCFGEGYYTQSGIVPPDSVKAGTSCGPAYGDPYDQKIMGLMQVSESEQEFVQKHISSQLPKNDRRVLFDNALMFAYISRSRIPGSPPKDCNSWPDDAVRTIAEKHAGNCDYYYSINSVSGDYCKEILDLYKQYKKEGY